MKLLTLTDIQEAIKQEGYKCHRHQLYGLQNLPESDYHIKGQIRLYTPEKALRIALMWAENRATTVSLDLIENYLKTLDK